MDYLDRMFDLKKYSSNTFVFELGVKEMARNTLWGQAFVGFLLRPYQCRGGSEDAISDLYARSL